VHANLVLWTRSPLLREDPVRDARGDAGAADLERGVVYRMPQPIMVMATQNPSRRGHVRAARGPYGPVLEKEVITYPSPHDEVEILDRLADARFGAAHHRADLST
jgi:MoxR-like ATPase